MIEMEVATPRESADGLCTESEAAGARTEDPGLSTAREAALRGTQTRNATSCGNVCETNILLASSGQRPSQWKSIFFTYLNSIVSHKLYVEERQIVENRHWHEKPSQNFGS